MDLDCLIETKLKVKAVPSLKSIPDITVLQFSESSYLCAPERQG